MSNFWREVKEHKMMVVGAVLLITGMCSGYGSIATLGAFMVFISCLD